MAFANPSPLRLTAPASARAARKGGATGTHDTATAIGRAVAAIALVIIGARIQLPQGLTAGYLVATLLIPVWAPVLRRFHGGVLLTVLGLAAAVNGMLLTDLANGTAHTGNGLMLQNTFVLVGTMLTIGVVLWARTLMPIWAVGLLFGIGLVLGIDPHGILAGGNPWKFVFAVPVTIVALSLATIRRSRPLELVMLVALSGLSMVSDARSGFAILLLTAVLVVWQMRPAATTRRASTARVILGLLVISAIAYNVGQSLIVDGALGQATQQRTITQIDTSGSLILGGRPELAATTALMQHYPFGFGSGVYADSTQILVAKQGMYSINYAPNNGYVDNFMFGTGFELHSMIGDLWAGYGVAGLALAVALLWYTLRGLGHTIAQRTASALLIYLAVRTLWSLFFGPWYSSVTLLTLLIGIALIPRASADEQRGVLP
ncbi:hypothetical protein ABCS02_00850 [Microbacterium sp. X-17]|uniref:hypothetical protein n=1 Tax=Microbacterium sp. X-17 TaxID=3144404 RepID=UPI0031F57B76